MKQALYLGVLEAIKKGIKKVILDANEDNIGSRKTIEAVHGKQEKEYSYVENGKPLVRYIINSDDLIKEEIERDIK